MLILANHVILVDISCINRANKFLEEIKPGLFGDVRASEGDNSANVIDFASVPRSLGRFQIHGPSDRRSAVFFPNSFKNSGDASVGTRGRSLQP
jgi:hypothetical protein